MGVDISVVIPCLNEIETIADTIAAVSHELRTAEFTFEIIVVDNGSIDGSDAIASNLKAVVLYSSASTVAGVRNKGADMAKGQVLVFLDADIIVQQCWGRVLRTVYTKMKENDNFITGSHPRVPNNIQPILYSWYKGVSDDLRDTHLGTGHMIVSMNIFKKIGGFNQSLVTGEDYYFCYHAKKMGITIASNPEMKVFHLGYPNTLIDFAKREIWHGLGDCKNLKSILRSRIALCGVVFILINLLMLISLAIHISLFFTILIIVILMAVCFNLLKFGYGNIRDFFHRSFISFIYLISRGLSLPVFYLKSLRIKI